MNYGGRDISWPFPGVSYPTATRQIRLSKRQKILKMIMEFNRHKKDFRCDFTEDIELCLPDMDFRYLLQIADKIIEKMEKK